VPNLPDPGTRGLTVAVYDYAYTLQGYVNDYESCSVTFGHMDVGPGTLVLPESHPLVPQFNKAGNQVVPVTVTDRFGHRWTGRVDAGSTDDGDGTTQAAPGAGLTTVTLIDEWSWFKRLLASPFGPNPKLAYNTSVPDPEFDTRTGPIHTVVKGYITDAITRVYGAGDSPIVVVPAPTSDPSSTVTLQAKWTPIADLVAETLRSFSWTLTITLWLPGDDQPVGLVGTLGGPTLIVDMHRGADNAWIVWDDNTFLTRKVGVQAPASYGAVIGGSGSGTSQTFSTYVDAGLQASQGLYGFPEQFFSSTNDTDPAQDAAVQLAKTEGSLGMEASVENGVPWSYGDDFMVGDVVGVRALGVDVRERVTAVQMVDDRANGYRLVPTIGDDTATLTPLAALFKTSRALGSRVASIETGN
jgi:hypothetical protein